MRKELIPTGVWVGVLADGYRLRFDEHGRSGSAGLIGSGNDLHLG